MAARALALVLAPAGLTGCAWLLGHAEPPVPPAPFVPATARARASQGPLAAEARFLGAGRPLVLSRNLLGRAERVSNPLGADSFVFELSVTNRGPAPLVVLPQLATLALGDREPSLARTLDDYRRRWPAWAAGGATERADQAASYGHVLARLLLERRVGPGATAAGALAFPARGGPGALTLRLPYQAGGASPRRWLAFRWEPR